MGKKGLILLVRGLGLRVAAEKIGQPEAALAAGVDGHRRGHAGAQRRLADMRHQAQLDRQALHHSDPNQVYLGALYDGEIFGTQDGGKTWQAMPLPGEVQHIYSVACG